MGHRLLRINESIRETLSSVIAAEGLKDPRVGFVTVTGVETTPDLRHAKVYVSVLGKQAERERTMTALESSAGFLQARLNDELHMKRTPQLQFFYDETLDRALRIERLMKREEEVLGAEQPPELREADGETHDGQSEGAPEARRRHADGARAGAGREHGGDRVKALPAELDALCRRMRAETRVALAVHERPDTDALGAAAGMLELFAQLGAEARLYVAPGETLPLGEYLLPAGAVVRGMPAADLPLYALDCGAQPRLALERTDGFPFLVDIDHHHDNTRYGDLVYVRGQASSTSELVCDIARALGLTPSPRAATALYAGISFDSGHFRHASTSAHTFATAAWLAGQGVDVTAVYRELYERRSSAALRLWARAVIAAEPVAGGRGLVARAAARGLHRRRRARGRDRRHRGEPARRGRRGGRRTREGAVERAARAREPALQRPGRERRGRLRGGGGHRMAAGFSSDDDPGEVTAWLSSELARRLQTASS